MPLYFIGSWKDSLSSFKDTAEVSKWGGCLFFGDAAEVRWTADTC